MKFRKKPVVIEAFQWNGGVMPGLTDEFQIVNTTPNGVDTEVFELAIPTPEGTMHARPGDYIITGVKGEKYPCKPDIFAATYEPIA